MRRNKQGLGILFCIAVTMMISNQANAQVFFGFDNADFDDGAGIGATTTAGGVTATVVDVFAPEFMGVDTTGDGLLDTFNLTGNILRASLGDAVGLQVQSDDLGVDNPSVTDDDFFMGAGNEARDINPGEGFVIEFDVPVIITEVDFASLDGDGGFATVTIEGTGSFDIVFDAANGGDIFSTPFGTSLIPAGADITFTFNSPTLASANLRLDDFSVATSTADLSLLSFPFTNGTELDGNTAPGVNGVIGAATSVTSLDGSTTATMTLVDIFAPEFVNNSPTANILRASQGDAVTTQLQSNNLGIDNPSVEDLNFFNDTGNENRDINDREGLVFEFDVPVIFTEIDFGSFGGLDDLGNETEPGSMVIVTIEGVGSFNIVPDEINNPNDTFTNPFGTDFIPAGADITIEFSSPTTPSANFRIGFFTVSTSPVMADCILGDIDMSGTVDFLDIQPFIDVLASAGFQCEADVDEDGMVTFLDIQPFINILAGI